MAIRYIVMGIDECGSEFRPDEKSYTTSTRAMRSMPSLKEQYPEARRFWVEICKDRAYWEGIAADRYDDDIQDLY